MRNSFLSAIIIIGVLLLAIHETCAQDFAEVFKSGSKDQVIALVNKNPAVVKEKLPGGVTLLHGAALKGDSEVTHFLLQKGSDVNASDAGSNPPLTNALRA